MNWDDLRILLAVARFETIALAAPTLGMDATTAARRLKRLEAAIGQTLFERSSGRQRLTSAGRDLLDRAEKIESLLGNAPGHGCATQLKGHVRLSVAEGFGTWCVAPMLARFGKEYPRITVEMVVTNGFLSPSKRETDIAILLARPRKGPLVTRRLTNYSLGLFASANYLAESPTVIACDDLRHQTLIGYVPDFIYAPELHYLDEVAPGLETSLRSSSINAQYRLARDDGGIAVLPFFIGYGDTRLVRVLPSVRIERSFWLVTHQDTRNLPRIKALVRWLTAAITNSQAHLLYGPTDMVPRPSATIVLAPGASGAQPVETCKSGADAR